MKNQPVPHFDLPNPLKGFNFWHFINTVPWWFWFLPMILIAGLWLWMYFNFYKYD